VTNEGVPPGGRGNGADKPEVDRSVEAAEKDRDPYPEDDPYVKPDDADSEFSKFANFFCQKSKISIKTFGQISIKNFSHF